MKPASLVFDVSAGVLITIVLAVVAVMSNDPSTASISRSSSVVAPVTATPSNELKVHLIDFTDPTTLAWSLELGGTPAAALHDVSCTKTTGRLFVCRGLSPDGQEKTEEVTVSSNGSSWGSR